MAYGLSSDFVCKQVGFIEHKAEGDLFAGGHNAQIRRLPANLAVDGVAAEGHAVGQTEPRHLIAATIEHLSEHGSVRRTCIHAEMGACNYPVIDEDAAAHVSAERRVAVTFEPCQADRSEYARLGS